MMKSWQPIVTDNLRCSPVFQFNFHNTAGMFLSIYASLVFATVWLEILRCLTGVEFAEVLLTRLSKEASYQDGPVL